MGVLWFILAVIAALFLYWLRRWHRAWYGLSEVVIGLAILATRFLFTQPSFLLLVGKGDPWVFFALTALISLFTGIYAIVRGLDNMLGEDSRR
jgi:hypothetical protein